MLKKEITLLKYIDYYNANQRYNAPINVKPAGGGEAGRGVGI